ncbi:hypothetical protein Rin_00007420 [Candidatus Regiella insecticola 5.15]|uniref:Secreted protein n=1 Tax=Candidatus Regiella insecticola 5.15 TaxID=1005043 RepID=G2GY91_9ENTR|nr:hypothetical protein [Candidatus Regiella insecticola]EGY29282.1 hypothetical protein Rin_00007420 [Candidatus Regiella insecticola 5.15]
MKKITAILLFSAILSVPTPVLASAAESLEACKIQWRHKYMSIGPVLSCPQEHSGKAQKTPPVSSHEGMNDASRIRKLTLFL